MKDASSPDDLPVVDLDPASASSSSFDSAVMYITGSTKWDIFVVYIVFCVFFIAFCCVSVIFLFWCCPARDPNGGGGPGRSGFGTTSIYIGGSPTATTTRMMMRRSSSYNRILALAQEQQQSRLARVP